MSHKSMKSNAVYVAENKLEYGTSYEYINQNGKILSEYKTENVWDVCQTWLSEFFVFIRWVGLSQQNYQASLFT